LIEKLRVTVTISTTTVTPLAFNIMAIPAGKEDEPREDTRRVDRNVGRKCCCYRLKTKPD
jgi:hypothetical protein